MHCRATPRRSMHNKLVLVAMLHSPATGRTNRSWRHTAPSCPGPSRLQGAGNIKGFGQACSAGVNACRRTTVPKSTPPATRQAKQDGVKQASATRRGDGRRPAQLGRQRPAPHARQQPPARTVCQTATADCPCQPAPTRQDAVLAPAPGVDHPVEAVQLVVAQRAGCRQGQSHGNRLTQAATVGQPSDGTCAPPGATHGGLKDAMTATISSNTPKTQPIPPSSERLAALSQHTFQVVGLRIQGAVALLRKHAPLRVHRLARLQDAPLALLCATWGGVTLLLRDLHARHPLLLPRRRSPRRWEDSCPRDAAGSRRTVPGQPARPAQQAAGVSGAEQARSCGALDAQPLPSPSTKGKLLV